MRGREKQRTESARERSPKWRDEFAAHCGTKNSPQSGPIVATLSINEPRRRPISTHTEHSRRGSLANRKDKIMSDYQGSNGATNGAMMGFLVGAIVGAGVALLVAPASGSDTRRRLSESARKIGHDAADRFSEVKETLVHRAEDMKNDLRGAVEAGRAATKHG